MKQKTLSILAAIIVVGLLVIGFFVWQNTEDKDTTSNTEDTSQTTDKAETETDVSLTISEDPATSTSEPAPGTSPDDRPENVLTPILGAQTGSAQLLLPSLRFPEATMTTNPDDTFTLEASGLSLAALGNQELQIDGQYPSVEVFAAGGADITGESSVDLVVTSLTPNFYLESADGTRTDIDPAVQQQMVATLATAGIVIPEVSETEPATLPVSITPSTAGFEVQTLPEADFFALFATN